MVQRRVQQRGFTLIEVMLAVLIVGLLGSIAIPSLRGAVRKGHRAALVADARTLYQALTSYNADNAGYPVPMSTTTYAPLSDMGYFNAGPSLNAKLTSGKPMFYMATPDGSQFFTFLRLAADPTVIVAVSSTNLLPGICTQSYCEGVFLLQNGEFVAVDQGE
jgi:prepilin-type N-terminal cleavage/methylation domain-containing protein